MKYALVLVLTFSIFGCAVIPPKEVHTASGLARDTELDTSANGQTPKRAAIGASVGRGSGYGDTGKPENFTAFSGVGEFRANTWLALGVRVGFTLVDGDKDSELNGNYKFFLRGRYLRTERWAFYTTLAAAHGENSATSNGQTCYFFSCYPNSWQSSARVQSTELSLALTQSYYFNDTTFLAFTPTIYGTFTKVSFDRPLSGNSYGTTDASINYSAVLDFGHIVNSDQSVPMLFHAGAGLSAMRGFGLDSNNYRLSPLVFLGFKIAFIDI